MQTENPIKATIASYTCRKGVARQVSKAKFACPLTGKVKVLLILTYDRGSVRMPVQILASSTSYSVLSDGNMASPLA